MKYFIGADLGTSSLKLLLMDTNGTIIRETSQSYSVHYPHPAWSEQDPHDWWNAFVSGMKALLIGINPDSVEGIGISGQMHGLVILDKEDKVIRPAILWNDGRTDKETSYLNNEVGKKTLSDSTANIAFAGFTLPKILWVKENEPENFKRIHKIMLPKDYIVYKLTGVHNTDYSDASGTLLLDVKNKCWSKKMLDICGISEAQLPQLSESYQVVGTLLSEIAMQLDLPSKVMVVAGAGDNAAAAVGSGTVNSRKCNISLGTSGTVFITAEKCFTDPYNALHSFCHADGGYHLLACILSAASCNKWFCDDILNTTDYVAEQAMITDDRLGENDVFFLPYLMGERSPINDTDARGTFTGLRMNTSRADMVQAVLEGVAFAIRDNIEVARTQGIEIVESGLCGGGAKSTLWQKILCNVLNMQLLIPEVEQGPAYGSAMLAMVGTGAYPSISECAKKFVKTKEILYPQTEIAKRYNTQYQKYKDIYPTMRMLFKKIKGGKYHE